MSDKPEHRGDCWCEPCYYELDDRPCEQGPVNDGHTTRYRMVFTVTVEATGADDWDAHNRALTALRWPGNPSGKDRDYNAEVHERGGQRAYVYRSACHMTKQVDRD